ncbi:MAG: flavin-dependent oxidoreductase [Pseudomonadales bacterium]|nr:flavin-dependent oxidoreductase [Gammaproteobacteria bacterium]MBP6050216.1 flavin-dependent oxidoreductase [Pseudomonadales bacterium]MBK7169765.1 flavin-dependent oxidoreductase [Gammaproteobacteria bacterium]MBK7522200.1 flavin-dependent oxidoreductase [Gammaproteobacteria bacterium]MBK9664839.1 flavin-dependent oxidoreductase [Gammaproteobacteria bacterium]
MNVSIIGGGIGGLTTALALQRAGISCTIFESVGELRDLGVGINLLPHAVRVLAELDLLPQLREIAVETSELCYFNKFGQLIWREPRGVAMGYRWPQFSIHRGQLQNLLVRTVKQRLGEDALVCGHHLGNYENTGDGCVLLQFIERKTGAVLHSRSTDCVIAADGIHSRVRAMHYPDEGMPRWNGAILWRGVTESGQFLSGRSMFMAGHQDQKFVCYPISAEHLRAGRSFSNWIAELRYEPRELISREDWNRPGVLADFLPRFESWTFDWLDIPRLIRDASSIYEFPMVDRDPVANWAFGNVVLLGDAAHPMYPIGSNGASQAILDAACIANMLGTHGDPRSAFVAYDAERRPKTAAIVLANRNNGPEQVMQMAEERAPQGFANIDDVIDRAELEAVAQHYKRIAGFDPKTLNEQP